MATGPIPQDRALTAEERTLVAWLLDHGNEQAAKFRGQLEQAWVVSRCACGCASINFTIAGKTPPMLGMNVLSDYVWNDAQDNHFGIFVYAQGDLLSGLEVYGFGDATPEVLPRPEELKT